MKKKQKRNSNTTTAGVLLHEVRVCLNKLGLSFTEGEGHQGRSALKTHFDLKGFPLDIEVACQNKQRTIEFALIFPNSLDGKERSYLQSVINYINLCIVKLGHLAMGPGSTDIYFLASITLYGEGSQQRKITENFTRFFTDGVGAYEIFLRMMFSDPDTVMKEVLQSGF
jgi:hypothetical protein